MELDQLIQIIKQGEGIRTEFKEATDSVPGSFYETVVSFSNTDGGTILLGVDDRGGVKGINAASTVKLNKDIITALNTRDCINPPIYVQPFTIQHPNGLVMVVQISASFSPRLDGLMKLDLAYEIPTNIYRFMRTALNLFLLRMICLQRKFRYSLLLFQNTLTNGLAGWNWKAIMPII